MGLFNKEKYNKETYDQVETRVNEYERSAKAGREKMEEYRSVPGIGPGYDLLRESIHKDLNLAAQHRGYLAKMREHARKEATETHKQYDKLLEKAQDALKKVEDFEKEKLGMHQEKPEGELPNPEVDRESEEI